jgi:hypothetical protein
MLQKVVHITTIGIYRVNTTLKPYKENRGDPITGPGRPIG